jgi:hypothetical protein
MKLSELVKELAGKIESESGLVLITAHANAFVFVGEQLPDIHEIKGVPLDGCEEARMMRYHATKERVWKTAMFITHNPHVRVEMEADVNLHVWRDGDNYVARCYKLRSVRSERPTEDFVLDQE